MDYYYLVGIYEALEKTTKRLEKTHLLSEFLKTINENDLEQVILLLQGRIFPLWEENEIGVALRIIIKALSITTGIGIEQVEQIWKDKGDLGISGEECIKIKKQSSFFSEELSLQKVFLNLRKLAEIKGEGTVSRKIGILSELLINAKSEEAKYIIRTVIGELRIGLGEGTIRDSIIWAYLTDPKYDIKKNELILDESERKKYEEIVNVAQDAYNILNDFSLLAQIAKNKGIIGLTEVSLEPGRPVKVMLYQKAKTIQEAFEIVGRPAAFEYKYDGFRIQIHKKNEKITIYTRRLENVTNQFPEIISFLNNINAQSYILDAEAVGYDPVTLKYLPFQNISQRIKRKHDIIEMSKKFPVQIIIFDILYKDGVDLLKIPFIKRSETLQKIVNQKTNVKVPKQLITDNNDEAEKFYQSALKDRNEGIMVKNLNGIYKPGARVGYGLKIKPTMETIDAVIIGAYWGEGKRSQWLSSFTIAIRDETGRFLEIGKLGTGIKEKEEEGISFKQITEILKPFMISEKTKEIEIKPNVIVEVDYEEIQKSPTYSSGYALRFPRFVRVREDKSLSEITTLQEIKKFYEEQY